MLKIAVVYGGKSTEHDVSILTGLHLFKHVTADYHVTLIYLTRDNRFVYGSRKIDDYIKGKAAKARPFRQWGKIDCVINCCHGGAGEDGTLAAVMKFYNLPITSCDMVSAWQQQSKIITRQVLSRAGFVQPKFQVVSNIDLDQIKLPLPLVVKPEMQGSSIGVTVAHNKDELFDAIKTALQLDRRVIVEELIAPMREVNVAVMCKRGQMITSGVELVGGKNFFSFDEKYFNQAGGMLKKNASSQEDEFVNKIAPKVKELAIRAYELFGASGVVRSDFMIKDDQIILNENNTVPGFMAYHLWLKEKIPYGIIIDELVQDALKRHKSEEFITDFASDVLIKNQQLVLEI